MPLRFSGSYPHLMYPDMEDQMTSPKQARKSLHGMRVFRARNSQRQISL